MTQAVEVVHNAKENRFEARVEGALCVLDYHLSGALLSIDHTGVPTAVEGRGIAAALTREALETARRESWRVAPNCAYAKSYIERHPEYGDLLV